MAYNISGWTLVALTNRTTPSFQRLSTPCYVYLSDVSTNDHNQNNLSFQSWEAAFRKSRWFTRGWTTFIAPPSVEFFSLEGKRLGDKKSLERQVHEVTGLAVRALQGSALFEFSVAERMSWAENRETKREEDKAYSPLGLNAQPCANTPVKLLERPS
jgi:hypothetical protein